VKTKFITIILLIIAGNLFAQTDIKNQIIAFTDSTEIMIRNGRKLILEKTVTGNHQEALETLNYLKNNVDNSYVILYPSEELLFSLATSNFELFLYDAKNFNNLMGGKTKAIQADEIGIPLQQYIFQEMDLIKKDLANSKLSEENQQFIKLYIDYYEGIDKLTLNKSIKNYKKTYPNTEYDFFLNELKQYTSTSYINFCIGYGHEFLNGNISNSFDSHFQIMSLECEGFVNQTYFSLFMNGSVGKIYSKIDMPVLKTDLTQKAGDEAFSLKYGVKLGRSWYSNKTFNAFSYLSLGGYQMNAQKSNFENSDSTTKYKLSDSFFTGVGTACDIVLKNFLAANTKEKIGSVFIRPNFGYDIFLTGNEISKGGSFYFAVSMGIGIGG
jgi:hypothetical protein